MKKRFRFTKLLAALLATCSLLLLLAACQTEGTGTNTGTAGGEQNGAVTTESNLDPNGFLKDALPALDYNRGFKILGNDNRKHQFWNSGEDDTDTIGKVIYERNATVEERLGVELEWDFQPGEGDNISTFIGRIETNSDSGDPYDGVIAYNLVPQMVAVRGYAANLYDTEYIDLSAPWWPSVYLREMVVNDQLYCLVESGSYGLLDHMMAMYFDNEMLEKRNMESPYTLVASNEWTIENLSAMIKETYEDADADSKVGDGDIFGCVTATKSKMDCWFFGLGNQFAKVENDEVVSLLGGDHIETFISTMVTFLDSNDVYAYDSSQFKMFMEHRAYFYCASVMLSEKLAASEEAYNYGVVPMPKMNSEQERYYTHVANCHDTWCLPYNVKDLDCSSAVMECMASEAHRQIDPMYYETYVKLRYAPDERLAEMYDLIRDSVTFDFTYLFSRVYSSMPGNLVKNCYLNPAKYSWASVYASNKSALESSFQQIVDTYREK
ncbi:MAG: hypothetical protein IJX28_00825 [Clostridia bacterium]|nr:hypothetical protein [Clostridia bacterium]